VTNSPELVVWLTLLDTIVRIARTLLPEAWARYCVITGPLEGSPPGEDAARARLLKKRSVKTDEAVDWGALLGTTDARSYAANPGIPITLRVAEMRRLEAQPPPDPTAQQRIALAQEALRLEAAFAAALVVALRAERWEAEATDDRAPMRGAGRVHPTTWTVNPAVVIIEYSEHAINLGGKRWLRNMRLRPAGKHKRSSEATGAPAPDPVLLAALQKYAEQQFKERGGKRVKQETLVDHAQRILGLDYRASRELARSLPEHLIYPARRRPK
jgi:hypothetical protein